MEIVTVRRLSTLWCRCEYRPLSAGEQDQAQVEKECQEETISSICSGKAERPTGIMQMLGLSNRFTVLQEDLSIEEKWELFSTIVKASADTVIGRKRGTNRERWISDRTWNLINDRKEAKKRKDQAFTRARAQAEAVNYRKLDKEVKKSCKQDKKDWIECKCTEAQEAASRNDIRGLYGVVRQLTGAKDNTNVPIMAKDGRLLLTGSEQNLRWKEHFEEVLNQPEPLSTPDFEDTVMAISLEVYAGNINLEEVQRAVSSLMNNKAPGVDEISAEMLKHGSSRTIG